MPRSSGTRLALLLLLWATPGEGQAPWRTPVEPGIVRILLQPVYEAAFRGVGVPGDEGDGTGLHPLGRPLSAAALQASWLEEVERGLAEALADPAFRLALGSSSGYLKSHVNRLPMEVAVGVTRRITVGGRWALVRRRVDGSFAYLPDGGEVGRVQDAGAMESFLRELEDALGVGGARLALLCAQEGAATPACREGEATLHSGGLLLQGLRRSWGGGPLLPATGTAAGDGLEGLVEGVSSGLMDLGVGAPLPFLPLPGAVLGRDDFQNLFLGGSEPAGALFRDGLQELWTPGDPEFFLLFTVLEETPAPLQQGPGWRVLAEVGGRVGVEDPAPLLPLLPLDPIRGHHALWVAGAGEARLAARWGLHADVAWERTLPRDVPRLGGAAGGEAPTLQTVRVEPGGRTRLSLTPNFALTSQLSLSAGYTLLRWGAETVTGWPAVPDGAPSGWPWGRSLGDGTLHGVAFQLDYSGLPSRARGEGGLPVELRIRGHRSVAGHGSGLVAPSGVEAGLRIHRRIWGGDSTPR